MNEQWVSWEPIKKLSSFYFIKSFLENENLLKVVLVDEENKGNVISIEFKESVLEYHFIDEYFWLDDSMKVESQYPDAFHKQRNFFKIINSSYIQNSYYAHGVKDQLHHFVIIEEDYKIDIISSAEPITFIISGDKKELYV